MKAILEFDLSNPDDREDHERMFKAQDMAGVIWELSYNLKKTIEREIDANPSMTAYDALDMFYKQFWELVEDASIDIDKLYSS